MQNQATSIVMLGATGAVGTQALKALLALPAVQSITTLGRRPVPDIEHDKVKQHNINIFKPETYQPFLLGHQVAICTLGVGEPSKVSKEDFLKIDKLAVLDFAKACKKAGVQHFELLASVGINANSRSFYLRTKGELIEELKALNFERLSIFQPSMILTPTNRYGMSQAVLLNVWPVLSPVLLGGLKKYRGIKVEDLGRAFAKNLLRKKTGVEMLTWTDFQVLNQE